MERGLSSNAFASGASQNSGNVITDRPTTRIHHAPGGASSFSLSWDDSGKENTAAPARAPAVARFAKKDVEVAPKIGAAGPARVEPLAPAPAAPVAGERTSSNVWASGANQNSGNFITDRPTTRVHAAPGGKSSMSSILSWG